jgi:hypothetical protein
LRKNDLIKLLQGIKGNPEVMLWNGYAGDYQHIKGLQYSELTKQTKEGYLERIRLGRCIDLKDWNFQFSSEELKELEESYKKYIEWEYNEFVTEEDVKEGRYKVKNVWYITSKTRGKTSFDRYQSLEY